MARWRLTQPHYLNTVNNDWEYRITSRSSGRQATQRYNVPRLFDPNDPSDCNEGEDCVVCHEGKGTRKDHIFFGPPTPDMEPLDDEAQKITDAESKHWVHPIEGLTGNYSQSLLENFEKQLAQAIANAASGPKTPIVVAPTPVPDNRVVDLERQVAELKALLGPVAPPSEVEDDDPPTTILERVKSAGASRRA